MSSLQRGQRFPLPSVEAVQLELTLHGSIATAVNKAVFVIDRGRMGSAPPSAIVSHRDPAALDGAIRFDSVGSGRFHVDTRRLGDRIERMIVAVWVTEAARRTATHLAQLDELSISVVGPDNTRLAIFAVPGSELGRESALVLGELYLKSGKWRFRADGGGYLGGLPSMASKLKLPGDIVPRLDGAHAPAPPPSPAPPAGGGDGGSGSGGSGWGAGHVMLPRDWPGGVKPHKIPAALLPAVARVEVQTREGKTHGGTAFAITPGGTMLTCHHVVEDAVAMTVTFRGTHTPRRAEVLVSDAHADIALIRLVDPWGVENWLRLKVSHTPPDLGDEVGLVGYPLGTAMGSEITFSRGIINSVRTPDGLRVLQIDAGAAPGSSGGPVFMRETGEVIGVLTSGLAPTAGMHANFAIDVNEMRRLGWLPH